MEATAAGNNSVSSTGDSGGRGGSENDKVEPWTARKPEGGEEKKKKKCDDDRKKVRVEDGDCGGVEEIGCWTKFKFFGSCIPSRSKVDNSTCGTGTNYGNSSFLWGECTSEL